MASTKENLETAFAGESQANKDLQVLLVCALVTVNVLLVGGFLRHLRQVFALPFSREQEGNCEHRHPRDSRDQEAKNQFQSRQFKHAVTVSPYRPLQFLARRN